MIKEIKNEKETRENLKIGVDILANTVKVTLGPMGQNVIIEKANQTPHVTKDGVTVAKEIELQDPDQNMGARLAKDAASKAADLAGDGTSTTLALTQSMVSQGMELIEAGANPMELRQGIDIGTKLVVDQLKAQSTEIKGDKEKVRQIATISSNNDKELGNLIAGAFEQMGPNGVITVEESIQGETRMEVVKGMSVSSGATTMDYILDVVRGETIFENPLVVIADHTIKFVAQVLPFLEIDIKEKDNRPILLICENVIGEAQATIVTNATTNRRTGQWKIIPVSYNMGGPVNKLILEDIAIFTGATVVSENTGKSLDKFRGEYFGECKKVVVTADETTIIEGGGDSDKIKQRILQVQSQVDKSDEKYMKDGHRGRVSRLDGNVAILHIGGATSVERNEKMDLADDSLQATRAAIEEGYLPGGGVALLGMTARRHDHWDDNIPEHVRDGISIVYCAIEAPFVQIVENTGILSLYYEKLNEIEDIKIMNAKIKIKRHSTRWYGVKCFLGLIDRATMQLGTVPEKPKHPIDELIAEIQIKNNLVAHIQTSYNINYGYDAREGELTDMVEAGIIDPTKVVRVALESAASVSGVLLTASRSITIKRT